MSVREPRIDLVPWDYDSPAHVERMYIQRLACGWRSEEVHTKWVELSRAKKKTLYWVVSVFSLFLSPFPSLVSSFYIHMHAYMYIHICGEEVYCRDRERERDDCMY